ncbi:four-domain proteases inhibitor-like [Penaeus japonicus]|uniref:four-domain proteases inhibitor-like n=1 Tax=Penaeus japonicus TaxID=27405 RepID=UPI001C711E24|nr:four-domain proteases inhibitor-like [Penaeus japonicus]
MIGKVTLLTLLLVVVAVCGYGNKGRIRLCGQYCGTRPGSRVCGSDGKTYESLCHLENARCGDQSIAFRHHGSCRPPVICPGICPAIYAPVCGTNGKTYASECQLNNEAKCNGLHVSKKHDGPCSESLFNCAT